MTTPTVNGTSGLGAFMPGNGSDGAGLRPDGTDHSAYGQPTSSAYVTPGPTPLVSVLITTFNRAHLVGRAIRSVLMQSFDDFEIVVIDDCSSDNTRDVVGAIGDPRIRYVRNDTNIGAMDGDRAHIRRFVYELMRGKYFAYLCDDDYWLPRNLLERQVWMHETNPDLAFVFGNQLSHVLTTPESYFGGSPDRPITLTRETLSPYFDFATNRVKSLHLNFYPKLFPKELMTSSEYLRHFSTEPTTYNRIDGGTLFSRTAFVKSGAFSSKTGSRWQAGYEFKIGPACVGGVGYIDEPAIVTEIREQNASFQRTQADHYLDAVDSIERAFAVPLSIEKTPTRGRCLRRFKAATIRNLTRAFVRNTIAIRSTGSLGMCSADNMARPVTWHEVRPIYARNKLWMRPRDVKLLCEAELTRHDIRPSFGALGRIAHHARSVLAASRAKT